MTLTCGQELIESSLGRTGGTKASGRGWAGNSVLPPSHAIDQSWCAGVGSGPAGWGASHGFHRIPEGGTNGAP